MADLTFLMNVDPSGDPNHFYSLARQFFVAAGSTVVDAPAAGQTLEGVFTKLKALNTPQGTINLVSHAFGFGAMPCPVTLAAQTAGRTLMTADDLVIALQAKSLTPPGPAVITDRTRVVIYGCDIGRSLYFLRLLCGLFGAPGELLAPKRMSVFVFDGTTVKYRQAQTWSLVRTPPDIIGSAAAPPQGWASYRSKFVAAAHEKFGRIALADEPVGLDRLKDMLDAAAKNATRTFGPTFFFEEGADIIPQGSQTAAEAAASVKPISNGDPITATPKSALEVDDTTMVTTISGADAYPSNPQKTKFEITVGMLAQVIDQDVLIAEGPNYARVTAGKGLAPSPGPNPDGGGGGSGSGGGSGAGASNQQLQTLIDLLLADGATHGDVDALAAEIPQGDATEGLVMDTPDDTTDTGEPVAPVPSRQELA